MYLHDNFYQFWQKSQGVWTSPLVTVTVNWLDRQGLLSLGQMHQIQLEFGVNMMWKYHKKSDSGSMAWGVDTNYSNLVFTDKNPGQDGGVSINSYEFVAANKLVMAHAQYEETFYLASDNRRLRELRIDGKLVRRLWEDKVGVEMLPIAGSLPQMHTAAIL